MSNRSLEDITANGMCLGCGLCAGVLKRPAIRMAIDGDGYLRPSAVAALSEDEQDLITATCPGIVQRGPETDAAAVDRAWGPVRDSLRGHAADEEMRFVGSSGGAISAIATHLLDSHQVDFVLHVAADPLKPLQSVMQLSRSRTDVLAAASARYGPAAPLARIEGLLAQGRRFAVIGKPCDIAGIRNLARRDPRVDALIPVTVAFFCAGLSSLRISERLAGKHGVQPDDVKMLRYRGHGCPGPTRLEARDGRVYEQSYDDTWSSELNQEIQFRCKICPDSTGEQADIACGDAWESEDGYSHGEQEGWTAMLARTERGAQLIAEMRKSGALVAEPLALERIKRAQSHHTARKQAIAARLAGMALAGAKLPSFRGLRLMRNAAADVGSSLRNVSGAARRWRKATYRQDKRVKPDSGNGWLPYLATLPLALFCLCTIVLPLLAVALYAFWTQNYLTVDRSFTLANFAEVMHSPLYLWLIGRSLGLAAAVTALCISAALPVAYYLCFRAGRWAPLLLLLFLLPYWTSYLLRIFSWKVLLGFNGIVNSGLQLVGLIAEPIEALLYSPVAVVIALTHAWLPFAILPIYASMSRIDHTLLEASTDLGASRLQTFAKVVLPLSLPGIVAAAVCAFIPILVDYVTPALVGGPSGAMIGNIIYAQFTRANNWPLGSALSLVTMAVTLLAAGLILLLARSRNPSPA